MSATPRVSVVIPTYLREGCLVNTLRYLLNQCEPPDEIVVVDQTSQHLPWVDKCLNDLQREGKVRWVRQGIANASLARNRGAAEARFEVLLYLDDDIIPSPTLVRDHRRYYESASVVAVAGQVFSGPEGMREDFPVDQRDKLTRFLSGDAPRRVRWIIGSNFSVRRDLVIKLNGFDENFVPPGYYEENDFAERLAKANYTIIADPGLWIIHLAVRSGGHRLVRDRFPGWHVSLGYFIFAFRHAREPAAFAKLFWRALRAGPLKKDEVCRPWRWVGGLRMPA
jgi:GT2 family glycosyltransferase